MNSTMLSHDDLLFYLSDVTATAVQYGKRIDICNEFLANPTFDGMIQVIAKFAVILKATSD